LPAPLCVSNIIETLFEPLLIEGCHLPIVLFTVLSFVYSCDDYAKFHCSVTRNYFENLVQALEAGLEDVRSTGQAAGTSSTATSSKKGGTKSKKKQHSKPSSDHTDDSWPCERCTYLNLPSVDACSVCEKSRY
jgi:hypothetical protein